MKQAEWVPRPVFGIRWDHEVRWLLTRRLIPRVMYDYLPRLERQTSTGLPITKYVLDKKNKIITFFLIISRIIPSNWEKMMGDVNKKIYI